MASVKGFYGKQTQYCFLFDAVNQIRDDDPESADVVIIGPPKKETKKQTKRNKKQTQNAKKSKINVK